MAVYNNVPLVIPDVILVDTLNLALAALRQDYEDRLDAGKVQESLLYLLLNSLGIGKYHLLNNAVEILVTTPTHPKHIDVKLSYDRNTVKSPAIFVTLASENERNNSLQIGAGDQSELIIASDSQEDQYREQYMRRYSTTYNIVIVCENKNEMTVLYNVIKSLIVTCINHLTLAGLSNIKVGGQDIRLDTAIPDKIFTRAITINFEYEQVVPSLVVQTIYRTLRLYWKMDDATTAQGPIEISTDDDLGESESDSNV